MRKRDALGLLALCVSLVCSSVAGAQTGESEDELLRRGFDLRGEDRDEEALALFERAHAIDGSTRALAQIGLAEIALERWVDAHRHLATAIEGDHPWVLRNRAALESALDAVVAHVARVRVRGLPAGSQVRLEGGGSGETPLHYALAHAPGSIDIEVTTPDGGRESRSVEVGAGQVLEVTFDVPRAAPPDAVAETGATDDTAGSDPGPWVLLGVSGAVVVAGAVVLALGVVEIQAVEDPPDATRWADVSDRADLGLALTPAGIIALSVGVVGVAAALAWWLVDGSDDERAARGRPGVFVF